MPKNAKPQFIALFLAALLSFSCSNTNEDGEKEDNYDLECGFYYEPDNVIEIKFNNGGEPTITNPYESNFSIAFNGENVIVNNLSAGEEYNLIVSGTTVNGSLKIYGNRRMGLYLNNANITNPNGPAINIQNNRDVSVHLVNGTVNYLADGTTYGEPVNGEDAKGTFFSEGHISFSGCGVLNVVGKYAHAIVVDNDIEIANGKLTVAEAARDGIHANGEIYIRGGILSIASSGDAIQSEGLPVRIVGGKITAKTTGVKSHGISSADSVLISGDANINIETFGNGAKGIKSDGVVIITGGKTNIRTNGSRYIDNYTNPPDTSSAAGIKVNNNIEVSGGILTVKTTGEGSKGINAEGNLTVKGGDIKVSANDDGIKIHGDLFVNSGNVCAWSLKKEHIDCNGLEITANDRVNGSKCTNGF